MSREDYFNRMVAAIQEERKNEKAFYERLSRDVPVDEKVNAGILWKNLEITNFFYTAGEFIEMVIPKPPDGPKNKFKVGQGCILYHPHHPEERYNATISYEEKKKIRIVSSSEKVVSAYRSQARGYYLELIYDDRPYKVMEKALIEAQKKNDPTHDTLKSVLVEEKDITARDLNYTPPIIADHLNESQAAAIKEVLVGHPVSIIHGPPGTGKTTTLVEVTRHIVAKEKQTLVCAPSNTAVDLLAARLHAAGLNVLRVGNITRIDDEVTHLTLAEKLRNHPEWSRIKKVKIEAEEAYRLGGSYKRSFGPQEREDRKRYRQEARELKKWARDLEDRLTELLIDEAQVICTTLIGSAHRNIAGKLFKTVLIDEASQAMDPQCWAAINKAEKVICAGDPIQLPPTVKSTEAMKLGLGITILDRLSGKISSDHLLTIQYRMNDDILAFPNQAFYDGRLASHPSAKNRKISAGDQAYTYIDTVGCGFDEDLNYKTKSLKNEGEFFIVREFLLRIKERIIGHSIGIISPYGEQVRFLRSAVEEETELSDLDIEVNTIDGFQGEEKDFIIISLVRSNPSGEIGFLADFRRLNVAMTRARMKLVVIGDSGTLGQHKLFLSLIEHAESSEAYASAWEYMSV